MSKAERIQTLRDAALRATEVFLEITPERSNGSVALEEKETFTPSMELVYRRFNREYGLFVQAILGDGKDAVALHRAPDRWLIAGCRSIRALYDCVWESVTADERAVEESIEEATSFAGEFESLTSRPASPPSETWSGSSRPKGEGVVVLRPGSRLEQVGDAQQRPAYVESPAEKAFRGAALTPNGEIVDSGHNPRARGSRTNTKKEA